MRFTMFHGAFAFVLIAAASCARKSDDSAARAEAAAAEFGRVLRSRLQAVMASGGPIAAVAVCNAEAPSIAANVSRTHRVRVGRASLRTRSNSNATAAPQWVRDWLSAQGERAASGLAPVRTVVGDTTRLLKPIAVEPVCLTCHGDRETMAPALREALSARYPDDRATGYRVGDLRGALWVEAPHAAQ